MWSNLKFRFSFEISNLLKANLTSNRNFQRYRHTKFSYLPKTLRLILLSLLLISCSISFSHFALLCSQQKQQAHKYIHATLIMTRTGGIKLWCCLTSDVCLSVAYIGPKPRTERPIRKTTSHSDTTFKVKRSKVKVTRPLWLVVLAGQHRHTVMVTFHMRTWRKSCHHLQAWAGSYRGGRPPTACFTGRMPFLSPNQLCQITEGK